MYAPEFRKKEAALYEHQLNSKSSILFLEIQASPLSVVRAGLEDILGLRDAWAGVLGSCVRQT